MQHLINLIATERHLLAITHANDNLQRCVSDRGSKEERFGITLGEVDWYCALHDLIYREDAYMSSFANNNPTVRGRHFEPEFKVGDRVRVLHTDPNMAASPIHGKVGELGPKEKLLGEYGFTLLLDEPNAEVKKWWLGNFPTLELLTPSPVTEIGSSAKFGLGGAPTRCTTLPTDAAGRKAHPVASGFMDYFPDAIAAISHLSWKGNEQHNPGEPLHWNRGKSGDEADTMLRHFLQRGTVDADGIRHSVKSAWRALALLQKEIEGEALTSGGYYDPAGVLTPDPAKKYRQ